MPTSIVTESERQDDKSTLANIITGSLKSTIVALKKNLYVLPSGDTTPLHNQTNTKNTEIHPIKKRRPKLIKSLNILKQIFNNLKQTNRNITHMIILL